MGHKTIRHTITRNGIYYARFRLPGNRYFRKSLETDSYAQAHLLMSFAFPVIPLVQRGSINPGLFADRLSEFSCHLKQQNENWLMQQFLNDNFSKHQPLAVQEYREVVASTIVTMREEQAEPKEVLTLAGAWNMYKKEKAKNWTKAISQANERFMEVMLIVLGASTDVTTITKQDIKQVMEVVENLPKRVVQPYRTMTVQQLIECDDVPPEDLVGAESIHKHLKIYKSLFKTFLTDNKDILEKSPTDGVVAAPSKARFGAYSATEMRKFVGWALKQPDGWEKWVTLLLAYTGARRGEIAKLEKSQIKYDEDSQRHYLLIAEGGQGKTENATRQVAIHPKLIEWGFLDFVNRQWKEKIFSPVSGKNMPKIGKVLADVRDQLGIPYLDDYGQRRLVHSFRHTMISACLAGWVGNLAHLQQVVGHEKSGSGITRRYLHTFPLRSVCYVIDGLDWLN
ncbi:integrase [Citrobacter freundii]|uniref:integrase n=1 Tax=Citrobacter freundii complex TaxID=1344959 RepID=UPI000B5A625C|nr:MULTISPECIES: integrase [Citrobacter freundii complex]POV67156.1 integrase [Citrobacter freundii complex sp. CFNIH11]ASK03122.1 integrase [Citrobacter freundii]AUZ72584.1 integrase [Citrobacter freundii complex sp. CFNIH4]EKU1544344.1 integrase [Citrobacter freundii]EMD6908624.1 integrase [Citrobacter freundii]